MSDITSTLRRVKVITDRGTIRQQISALHTLLNLVNSYVAEVREEEELLKSLPRLEAQLRRSKNQAEDDEELRELKETIAEIKDKRMVVEQKIRALRELGASAQQPANLLR